MRLSLDIGGAAGHAGLLLGAPLGASLQAAFRAGGLSSGPPGSLAPRSVLSVSPKEAPGPLAVCSRGGDRYSRSLCRPAASATGLGAELERLFCAVLWAFLLDQGLGWRQVVGSEPTPSPCLASEA